MTKVFQGPRAPQSTEERLAWLIGTGLGSGMLRPFPATWGSIVGFAYWAGMLVSPWEIVLGSGILLLVLAVWSGNICEQLFGRKDPKPVVIDEIACVPIALWPMYLLPEHPWYLWAGLFVAYRIFDIIKPWPGRRLERLPGGWGVLLDDFVAALYMGVIFYALALIYLQ